MSDLHLQIPKRLLIYLEWICASGFFGHTVEETAERLLSERVVELTRTGWIERVNASVRAEIPVSPAKVYEDFVAPKPVSVEAPTAPPRHGGRRATLKRTCSTCPRGIYANNKTGKCSQCDPNRHRKKVAAPAPAPEVVATPAPTFRGGTDSRTESNVRNAQNPFSTIGD